MSIFINRAAEEDLKPIAELFDAYRVFYQQSSDINVAYEFLKKRFENNESVIFYARDEGGQYLGFTQLFPSFSSVSAQRSWILNDLYVRQDIRSTGVGTQLLNQAKQFAIKTGAKGILLETAEDNTRAQKLYESLGYKKNTEYSYFLKV